MKIANFDFNYGLRRAGGIAIGLIVHFPVTLVTEDSTETWRSFTVVIGLVAWKLSFDVEYGRKPYE